MANKIRHELDCLHLLDKPMPQVHEWLDEMNEIFPFQLFGDYHRSFRHNSYGVEYCSMKWGIDGKNASLIHLLRDWNDSVYIKHMNLEKVLKESKKALIYFNTLDEQDILILPQQFKSWEGKSIVAQAIKEGLFEKHINKGKIKKAERNQKFTHP